jgi:hypothetical protein
LKSYPQFDDGFKFLQKAQLYNEKDYNLLYYENEI